MSIRLTQGQSQASRSFDMAEEKRPSRDKSSETASPIPRRKPDIEQAHAVNIDTDRARPLASEIVHKRDNADASNSLELHESNAESVSTLLTRLRNLANVSTGNDELASRDLLAAADEYRALQSDLAEISQKISVNSSKDSGCIHLTHNLQSGIRELRLQLDEQLKQTQVTKPSTPQPSSLPLIGQLDATIGQIGEYQTYIQQLRSAVDTQLMKPSGANKELAAAEERKAIIVRLSESKRQIIESGSESLKSTKELDPALALRLLDSSK